MKTKYGYVPDTYIRFFTFPMIWVNQEEFEELSLQFARLAEGKVDYKLLFSIFNYYMNDENIKINIIDIIALIYSTEITNDKSWYEINQEINNLLTTLLYNEKNIEIAAHVVNAFMDIYQWDDQILNKILKNSNVLNIMSNGAKTFKQKMDNLYKTNEITEDTYQYISETLTNMKRFIKYKKDI